MAVGDSHAGGIVAYILQASDPGYSATVQHSLIAATVDQGKIVWALDTYRSAYVGTDTAIGTGSANTDAIIAQNGAGTNYAAGLARAYRGGGYSDWFLPSRDELYWLSYNRGNIGGFNSYYYYWSSSEENRYGAYYRIMNPGIPASDFKQSPMFVRAVRAF